MKEKNLESYHANMDILYAGLDVCQAFEWKDNLTDSTVWNTGEVGDIYTQEQTIFSTVDLTWSIGSILSVWTMMLNLVIIILDYFALWYVSN